MGDTALSQDEGKGPSIPLPTGQGTDAAGAGKARILLRFSGDITTKAPATRRRFLNRMNRNLKDALSTRSGAYRITRTHSRIFVDLPDGGFPEAVQRLSRIFGVQSLAQVEEREWRDLNDLVTAGVEIFEGAVRDRSFAVRARRVGDRKHIPVQSENVQKELGAALLRSAREVCLDAPEVTASVEISAGRAHFFGKSVSGPGGLPLGCEGRGVALVSGGFDSPVAAWLMLKRGVDLDYVFCNLGGRSHQLETLQVMKVISDNWSYGSRPHLHSIDFDEVTRDLQAGVTMRYWQIVLKRLMIRAAEAVAADRDAIAIVTGEAVGQVSSQTLPNLAVISAATRLPLLRPLVGCNKDEIIAMSRTIGTHDLSAHVGEYCALVPHKPATRASLARIENEEAALDPKILARAVSERSVFDLRTLNLESLERPEIQTDVICEGEVVLDLRSEPAYQAWHYPDALFLDFRNALRVYPQLDPNTSYVLYCEFGLKSGHLADLMRREGMRASHFAGGLKALIDYTRKAGLPTPGD